MRAVVLAVLIWASVSCVSCASLRSALDDEGSAEQAQRLLASTVKIAIVMKGGLTGAGSGFVAAPSLVLTAAHVCYSAISLNVIAFTGETSRARVVLMDVESDVCALRTEVAVGFPARIAAQDPPTGAHVIAVSGPRGIFGKGLGIVQDWRWAGRGEFPNGRSGAIYAGVGAAGSSGGPVFYRGQVIGSITALLSDYNIGGPVVGASLDSLRQARDTALTVP